MWMSIQMPVEIGFPMWMSIQMPVRIEVSMTQGIKPPRILQVTDARDRHTGRPRGIGPSACAERYVSRPPPHVRH